jgi:hypothetical protein
LKKIYLDYIYYKMVLMNGSVRARRAASISNQNQGGGAKKAGRVPNGLTEATNIAYAINGLPKSNALMAITANPNVRQSRPIGSRPMVWHPAAFGMNW